MISEAHRIALGNIYKESLYATCKDLLNYNDLNRHAHKEVTDALESSTKRKLLILPRGTFKTSIGSVGFPIWLLINNPNLRIMLDSELYTNSKNRLREIKQHMESERLVSLFGEFKTRGVWSESEIIIKQRTKILKEPSIFVSGIGASKTGAHADVIIADDLNSPLNSNTTEGCQKVIDHYRMYTSILDPNGTLVVIGTRYAALDVPGFILEQELSEGLM